MVAVLTGRPVNYTKTLCKLSRREHDLMLDAPFTDSWKERLRIPPGMAARPPKGGEVKSRFGSASLEVKVEGGSLVVRARARVGVSRVKAEDYPEFRRFVQQVDQLLTSPIVLKISKKGGGA